MFCLEMNFVCGKAYKPHRSHQNSCVYNRFVGVQIDTIRTYASLFQGSLFKAIIVCGAM